MVFGNTLHINTAAFCILFVHMNKFMAVDVGEMTQAGEGNALARSPSSWTP